KSYTPSGLVLAWDRGQLIKNVTFINFPSDWSHSMRGPEIIGTCRHIYIFLTGLTKTNFKRYQKKINRIPTPLPYLILTYYLTLKNLNSQNLDFSNFSNFYRIKI
ncbi:hypothetical protein BpHYR1_049763, partial [Brachionus plicatilis]